MMRRCMIVVAAGFSMWLACGGCAQSAKKIGPVIARDVLFGNPERVAARISPDGTRIAYLAPADGVLNVWVGPIGNVDAAKPVTSDASRGIRRFFWAYSSDHIVFLQDQGGDENWRVYSVNLTTGDTIDLTPMEGVAARIQHVSHKFPEDILIGINDRDPKYHDLYRVNIRTGDRQLVHINNGFVRFVTDDDLRARLAIRPVPDGSQEVLVTRNDRWEPYTSIPAEDVLTTAIVGFDKSGEAVYMLDSRGRDTAALVRKPIDSGDPEVIAESDNADIARVMLHPTEKTVQAAGANYLRVEWQFLNLRVAADFDVLRSLGGDVEVASRSLDDNQWIVAMESDDGPVRYYHYDRDSRKSRFLFTSRKALENAALAHMHPVVIESRDGLSLVSYLTLPVGTDPDENGLPSSPLPMVLFVHGGPWARDAWGYNSYHQWLANRGYAVLSVNFRGSTGFGKAFVNAGDREIGRKMQDDLTDAVNWAIESGVADRERIAIMGGSYGGYAVLAGLTSTPDVFACGVDIVGPSNLVTLLESIPPYWASMVNVFTSRIGDHRTEEGRKMLTERSPLSHVDRLSKPLLIAQGANDPRVKQAESDQIVSAMQAKDIPVTYVLFPDEGHGFARPQNSTAFTAVAEAFLAAHLGGRYEPIGDDFDGSSVSVPSGADQIEGLQAALDATASN